jgi:hypothetical protein
LKPKAEVEKRTPRNGETERTTPETDTSKERKRFASTQELETRLNVEFREERLGPTGQIYECHMEGRKTIVRYNVEHPFYQRFIVDNIGDDKLVTGVDFLIGSLAYAELRILNDDNAQLMDNLKSVLSANVRTLLT